MKKPATLLAALLALSAPAGAQELIAWPMGSPNPLRFILPGTPIRPIPRPLPPGPIPRPIPTPLPTPRPAPPPDMVRPPDTTPLSLSDYKVTGTINDKVAELSYRIAFRNPTPRRLEGVLLMPIPADTVLSGFTMTVGGKKMNAELLQADQAASIYETIVRRMQDPGLLELVGERMVRARVFPIEPNSEIIVEMKVGQLLEKSGGLYALHIPMRSAKLAGAEARDASVQLKLSAQTPLRTVYSPLPEAAVRRTGPRAAEVSFTAGTRDERDFSLFYSLAEDPLAAGVLSFKEAGEDGTFLLSLSPRRPEAGDKPVPKDLVFIVDRSGSMEEGGKLGQAKAALAYCVRKLGAADRFGIVDFGTDTNLFESALLPATEDNKARALRHIDRLESAGGTNIEAALEEGLKLLAPASGRVPMVFFMTDGLPTVGQTQMEALLRQASERNRGLSARLFGFGVGDDVNTLFLDKLAEANRGARDYVRPEENIEAKVSGLYDKVAKPALTDLRLEWQGAEVHQVYPKQVSDLFYGSELVLVGRYKGPGKARLVVTGKSGAKPVRFEYPVELPARAEKHAFLPRLWANHKVGHELDALRLAGGTPDPEAVASIVRLAKRYGIVTPYTSFLITEEGASMPAARQQAWERIERMRADASASGSGGAAVAMRAQKASRFLSAARGDGFALADRAPASPKASAGRGTIGGEAAPQPAAEPTAGPAYAQVLMDEGEKEAREELKKEGTRAVETRAVGGRTFYLRGGVWTDGEYEAGTRPERKLQYLSEDYFALLASEPALGRFLALGPKVIVVHGGTAYIIE